MSMAFGPAQKAVVDRRVAERAKADAPFRHTHNYHPALLDRFDPKTHPGSNPIEPGARVQKMGKQIGSGRMAFIHVRDEHGNHQQVFKGALVSKRQAMSSGDDAMRWSPEAGEKEISAWGDVFNDRRA